jgi:hypothetical protein
MGFLASVRFLIGPVSVVVSVGIARHHYRTVRLEADHVPLNVAQVRPVVRDTADSPLDNGRLFVASRPSFIGRAVAGRTVIGQALGTRVTGG